MRPRLALLATLLLALVGWKFLFLPPTLDSGAAPRGYLRVLERFLARRARRRAGDAADGDDDDDDDDDIDDDEEKRRF